MLIEIHAIQNHSPANLNRDDLGAPKTCYFGGVMRSRISSQCLKRSIRTSEQFKLLCGGVRTRRFRVEVAVNPDGRVKSPREVPAGSPSGSTAPRSFRDDYFLRRRERRPIASKPPRTSAKVPGSGIGLAVASNDRGA